MNVGDRIKKRRKEIRMSVDELADAVGKSRATIYRYENGDIEKLPVDVLLPFASALKTSPGSKPKTRIVTEFPSTVRFFHVQI